MDWNMTFFSLARPAAGNNSSSANDIRLHGKEMLTWDKLLFICLMIPLSVAGFVGNLVIIAAIILVNDLRTTANAFLANLAFSDIVLIVIVVPFNIAGVLRGSLYWAERTSLCVFVASICAPGCLVAIWSDSGVAFNRYFFMCHSKRYDDYFSFWKTLVWITGIWAISFAIHLPNHLGWGHNGYVHQFYLCTRETDLWTYSTFFSAVGIVLPILISFFSYFKIFLLVRKSKSARNLITQKRVSKSTAVGPVSGARPSARLSVLEPASGTVRIRLNTAESRFSVAASSDPTPFGTGEQNVPKEEKERSKFYKELMLAQTLMQGFAVFLVAWLPLAVLLMLPMIVVPSWLYLLVILLAHGSTASNALLYATNSRFRKGFREVWSGINGAKKQRRSISQHPQPQRQSFSQPNPQPQRQSFSHPNSQPQRQSFSQSNPQPHRLSVSRH